MNEMLRSLGFGQVTNTKWTNGEDMMINVNTATLDIRMFGTIAYNVGCSVVIDYILKSTDLETTKRHIEKFMRMVGKCIQVDEE